MSTLALCAVVAAIIDAVALTLLVVVRRSRRERLGDPFTLTVSPGSASRYTEGQTIQCSQGGGRYLYGRIIEVRGDVLHCREILP